jgi:protease II
MRPDLFRIVIAEVPFVDVMNTMSDATLPLSMGDYDQLRDEAFDQASILTQLGVTSSTPQAAAR